MIHSDPRTRKAAILLASIPEKQRKHMYVQVLEQDSYLQDPPVNTEKVLQTEFRAVKIENNAVELSVLAHDELPRVSISVPLEDILAVWVSSFGWTVRLGGMIRHALNGSRREMRYICDRRNGFY
jgi:hypothetical protein